MKLGVAIIVLYLNMLWELIVRIKILGILLNQKYIEFSLGLLLPIKLEFIILTELVLYNV